MGCGGFLDRVLVSGNAGELDKIQGNTHIRQRLATADPDVIRVIPAQTQGALVRCGDIRSGRTVEIVHQHHLSATHLRH